MRSATYSTGEAVLRADQPRTSSKRSACRIFYIHIFTANWGLVFFITLFVQYYSAICRPLDRTVGRPHPAGIRNWDGLSTVEATRPLHLLKKFIVSYFPPSMYSIKNQQNIVRQHRQSLKRNESTTLTFVKKQHSQPWSTVRDNISCLYVQRQGDNNRQQPLPMKLHETVTLHETNRQLQWISRDSIPYQQRSRR